MAETHRRAGRGEVSLCVKLRSFFFFLIFGEMNSGECDEAKGRHSFHSSCYTIKVADQPPRDQEQKPSRQVRGPTDQYSHGLVVQLKALFTKEKKKSPWSSSGAMCWKPGCRVCVPLLSASSSAAAQLTLLNK